MSYSQRALSHSAMRCSMPDSAVWIEVLKRGPPVAPCSTSTGRRTLSIATSGHRQPGAHPLRLLVLGNFHLREYVGIDTAVDDGAIVDVDNLPVLAALAVAVDDDFLARCHRESGDLVVVGGIA